IGYWENFGKGLNATTGLPTDDTTLLQITPIGTVATYRFDYLADHWVRWPLIPYAQIGLQYALWTSRSGTGAVSSDTVRGGRGARDRRAGRCDRRSATAATIRPARRSWAAARGRGRTPPARARSAAIPARGGRARSSSRCPIRPRSTRGGRPACASGARPP